MSSVAAGDSGSAISAIVCTYSLERWELLQAAISSLKRQRRTLDEIIVIVDHNEALEMRLRRELGGIIVTSNAGEPGLSGARNAGVEVATGEIVAWLDDDAEAAPDWSLRLAEDFSDPGVIGVGCMVVPRWEQSKPRWFPEEFNWVVGCTYRGVPQVRAPIRNPLGAAMALRRNALEEVGGFRSGLGRNKEKPLGCEETELCVRIRQQFPDQQIIQDPQARVSHLVPRHRVRWKYFCSRCWAEGLSKAAVTAIVGSNDGLATELSYVTKVLPAGVVRRLRRAFRGDGAALGGAVSIVAGLSCTTLGFIAGKLSGPAHRAAVHPPPLIRAVETNRLAESGR